MPVVRHRARKRLFTSDDEGNFTTLSAATKDDEEPAETRSRSTTLLVCVIGILLATVVILGMLLAFMNAEDTNLLACTNCAPLQRAWPADAKQCLNVSQVNETVLFLWDFFVNATSIIPAPGLQVAYYSRTCGLFVTTFGYANLSTARRMTATTQVPIGSASAALSSMASYIMLRTSAPSTNFDTQLNTFIGQAQLFETASYAVSNIVVAPRAPYANVQKNTTTCQENNVAFDALSPTVYFLANFSTPYVPNANIDADYLALVNGAGPTRAQCATPTDPHAGLQTIVGSMVTNRPFEQFIESDVLRVCNMCPSLASTQCLSAGFLTTGDHSNIYGLYNTTNVTASAGIAFVEPAERSRLVGRQCYSTATDLVHAYYAIFDNHLLTPAERQAFESAFDVCENLFNGSACEILANQGRGEPAFVGAPGFVRYSNAANLRELANSQLTLTWGDDWAFVGRWDSIGGYVSGVGNARSTLLKDFMRVLIGWMPMIDPSPETFVQDSTSSLHEPSLGDVARVQFAYAHHRTLIRDFVNDYKL